MRDLNTRPRLSLPIPEGAFYAWVNIAETGMSAEEVCRIMLEEGGVAAIPGRGVWGSWQRVCAFLVCVIDRDASRGRGTHHKSLGRLAGHSRLAITHWRSGEPS